MAGYSILSLSDIIDEKGEDFCREILSFFHALQTRTSRNF